MRNFKTAVSMPCNRELYDLDLRLPLLDMGYKEDDIEYVWKDRSNIVNNYDGRPGVISNAVPESTIFRLHLKTYDPDTFLALSAMHKDNNTLLPGEYVLCTSTVTVALSGLMPFLPGRVYKCEGTDSHPYIVGENGYRKQGQFSPEFLLNFRKLTAQEIIGGFKACWEEESITENKRRGDIVKYLMLGGYNYKLSIDDGKANATLFQNDKILTECTIPLTLDYIEAIEKIFTNYITESNSTLTITQFLPKHNSIESRIKNPWDIPVLPKEFWDKVNEGNYMIARLTKYQARELGHRLIKLSQE